MSEQELQQINELRQKGAGYKVIAAALGVSRDTVRGVCKRNHLVAAVKPEPSNPAIANEAPDQCACCGKTLIQNGRGRNKRFCSDDCRRQWWNKHPELHCKYAAAIYSYTCRQCGKDFNAYGDKDRKYCSHECYIRARFWQDEPERSFQAQGSIHLT